jgi:capsular polysaccharide transport system permease protein
VLNNILGYIVIKTKLPHAYAFIKRKPISLIIIPWLCYAFYLVLWAAPQYESNSQLIIKSTDGGSSFDPSSLLMSGIGSTGVTNDSQIVVAFITSVDMLTYLDKTINIRQHYMSNEGDIFSRLPEDHSEESFYEYFLDHIEVTLDSASSVITLSAKAFNPEFAQLISETMVTHAENFINEIGNNLAKSRLAFAQGEHDVVEKKLQKAKLQLLNFQSKNKVLDPTAEGAAFQQITFTLEATLAQKRAELNTLLSMMSTDAPEVLTLKRQISAIEQQIVSQKSRINDAQGDAQSISVSELMAQYSNLQVQVELAIQAYSSSLITLENARVEAYQQLQHLVTIQSPTQPDEARYPRVLYNLILFGVMLFVCYGIVRIVVATIKEL